MGNLNLPNSRKLENLPPDLKQLAVEVLREKYPEKATEHDPREPEIMDISEYQAEGGYIKTRPPIWSTEGWSNGMVERRYRVKFYPQSPVTKNYRTSLNYPLNTTDEMYVMIDPLDPNSRNHAQEAIEHHTQELEGYYGVPFRAQIQTH